MTDNQVEKSDQEDPKVGLVDRRRYRAQQWMGIILAET